MEESLYLLHQSPKFCNIPAKRDHHMEKRIYDGDRRLQSEINIDTLPKEKSPSTLSNIAALFSYGWKQSWFARSKLILGFLSLGSSIAFSISMPLILQKGFKRLSTDEEKDLTLLTLAGFGLAWLGQGLTTSLGMRGVGHFIAECSANLKVAVIKHLHKQSMSFHRDKKTGELVQTITKIYPAAWMLTQGSIDTVPILIQVVVTSGVLIYTIDWPVGVFYCSTIILYAGSTSWSISAAERAYADQQESLKNCDNRVVDGLLNSELVQLFNAHDREIKECKQGLGESYRRNIKFINSMSQSAFLQNFVLSAGAVGIFTWSGYNVLYKGKNPADVLLIMSYLLTAVAPLLSISGGIGNLLLGTNDLNNIMELLRKEVKDESVALPLKVDRGDIEFKDISFWYEGLDDSSGGAISRVILHDISFKIKAGEKIAFIGSTGSGKSTLVKLLLRFYDIPACDGFGQILIDGQDIQDVTLHSLRDAIGYTSQEVGLFNKSIAYNVKYGRPDATQEEVQTALRKVRLEKFIGQEEEIIISEGGKNLSGGEKQRIAIARVLLKQPSIFIFDEVTAALDNQTQQEIQQTLNDISKELTTLVVAHRLATIVDADQIIVLKNGTIVESGSHHQLLAKQGEYSHMWHIESAQLAQLNVSTFSQTLLVKNPLNNKRTTFLSGCLPDGVQVKFSEEFVAPNGNCGFTALGVSRDQVANCLMALKNSNIMRKKLASEIQQAFETHELKTPEWENLALVRDDRQTESSHYFRSLCEQFPDWQPLPGQELTEQESSLLKFLEEKNQINIIKEFRQKRLALFQSEEDLKLYCQKQEIFTLYADALRKRLWLGYESALIYAQNREISICIWRKTHDSSNQLKLIDHHFTAGSAQVIHILHTDSFTHFNLLIRQNILVDSANLSLQHLTQLNEHSIEMHEIDSRQETVNNITSAPDRHQRVRAETEFTNITLNNKRVGYFSSQRNNQILFFRKQESQKTGKRPTHNKLADKDRKMSWMGRGLYYIPVYPQAESLQKEVLSQSHRYSELK